MEGELSKEIEGNTKIMIYSLAKKEEIIRDDNWKKILFIQKFQEVKEESLNPE